MSKVMVLATEWGISYTCPSPFFSTGTARAEQLTAIAAGESVVLNCHRCDEEATNAWGGKGVVIRHPKYDGMRFATSDAAAEFALSVGMLKVYVPSSAMSKARSVLKPGFHFTHKHFLDLNWSPASGHTMREAPKAEMVVTRVTSSHIWYAYADGRDFQIGASRHGSWVTSRDAFTSRYLPSEESAL